MSTLAVAPSLFPLTLVVVFLVPFILRFLRHDKNRVAMCRNDIGFPALPNELYSEILNHLQAIQIPQSAYLDVTIDPRRHVTLLALSQTCKSLRSFFLQYAWERIEVFDGMWTPTGRLATKFELLSLAADKKGPFHAKFAQEICRQFETVKVRNPDLAQYVHFVNILFVNSTHETTILPQLANILSLLPDVHTLQISLMELDPLLDGVKFSQYPQIQTLYLQGLSVMFNEIILACPNLTSFTQGDNGILALRLLLPCSSRLHTLGIFSVQLPTQALATNFPHLRDITIDHKALGTHEDDLSALSSLPLHTLRLCLTIMQSFKKPTFNPSPADCERWIALAKTTLKNCPTRGSEVVRKQVVVITNRRLVESYPV